MRTNQHTNIRTYEHTTIRTYDHTTIRPYDHTNIRTYAPTHIRTYAHTNIRTDEQTNRPTSYVKFKHTNTYVQKLQHIRDEVSSPNFQYTLKLKTPLHRGKIDNLTQKHVYIEVK